MFKLKSVCFIISAFLLCSFTTFSNAQIKKDPDEIKFHGKVIDTDVRKIIVIIDTAVLGDEFNRIKGLDSIKKDVNNGLFDITIHQIKHIGYVQILFYDSKNMGTNNPVKYFFFPGDNLSLVYDKNQISFHGQGYEKYQLIENYDAGRFQNEPMYLTKTTEWRRGKGKGGWLNIDTVEKFKFNKLLHWLRKLNTIEHKMTYREFTFLRQSLIFDYKNQCLNDIVTDQDFPHFENNSQELSTLIKNQQNHFRILPSFEKSELSDLMYSDNYLNYLATSCGVNSKIAGELHFSNQRDGLIYNDRAYLQTKFSNIISSALPSQLKSKLLIRVGLRDSRHLNSEDKYRVYSCLSAVIMNEHYKTIIENLLKFYIPVQKGAQVADYSFIDTLGRTVKLSDFKGKVVVIDIWYSGCGGCKQVAAVMPAVEDMFQNNKKVIFLSLAIDENKEEWLASISKTEHPSNKLYHFYASMYYTGENTIYLKINKTTKTSDSDNFDPFIKVYNPEGSYPTLLIIDASGKFFMKNPPRPDVGIDGKNRFANVILEALENK